VTNAHCKNATCPPDKKRARLTDGEGLYLETSPAGSTRWFAKIYRDGKETRLALGSARKKPLGTTQRPFSWKNQRSPLMGQEPLGLCD
jgi:hypothetical protein